jgi:type IV pilus assembly protein PilQ
MTSIAAFAMIFSLSLFMLPEGTNSADLLSSAKPFSLKVRDVDIRDVLRVIAEEYKLNIVMGKGVEGRITYDIENTTLREGFNAILQSNGLGYVIEGNIIRVDDLKAIRSRMEDQLQIYRAQQELKQARKLEEPLQTKEIRLNFIGDSLSSRKNRVSNLKEILEPLLSHKKEKGMDRGANIQILENSNTLVITDVLENIREIEALAKKLDRPPAQVRIEARIVEINHSDAFGLGIQWGAQYSHTSTGTPPKTTIIGQPLGPLNPATLTPDPQNFVVNAPIIGEFSPVLRMGYILLDNLSLDIELQAMESQGKLKIISKPSVQVVENENADIIVGSQVPVPRGFDPQSGNVLVDQTNVGTTLSLVSQIAQDGSVSMVVKVERSAVGPNVIIQGQQFFTIDKKDATSNVRVKDGETVVIGGLLRTEERKDRSGVPVLSRIPILGLAFGNRTENKIFDETMIFLTPRILNPEKG